MANQVIYPQTIATELRAVQFAKEELERQEKELKDSLMGIMKKQGVKSVKLEDGSHYIRTFREVVQVVKGKEQDALKWAHENNALKVDTGIAKDVFRHSLKAMPKFFKKVSTEFLTIKKSNHDDQE